MGKLCSKFGEILPHGLGALSGDSLMDRRLKTFTISPSLKHGDKYLCQIFSFPTIEYEGNQVSSSKLLRKLIYLCIH